MPLNMKSLEQNTKSWWFLKYMNGIKIVNNSFFYANSYIKYKVGLFWSTVSLLWPNFPLIILWAKKFGFNLLANSSCNKAGSWQMICLNAGSVDWTIDEATSVVYCGGLFNANQSDFQKISQLNICLIKKQSAFFLILFFSYMNWLLFCHNTFNIWFLSWLHV